MSNADGFVPVDRAALRAISQSIVALGSRRSDLDEAMHELLAFCEDMKREAVCRLSERGASEAQIERYEAAFEQCVSTVRARASAFDKASQELSECARALGE